MSFAKSFGQVLFVYLKIHIVIYAYYLVSINYSHLQKACCHCFQSLLFFSFYQPYQRNKRGLSVKVKSLQAQFINLKKSKCYFPENGLFQKKKDKQEGTYFFENPWSFQLFYFAPGNSKQNKASPLQTPQNCYTLKLFQKTIEPKPLY